MAYNKLTIYTDGGARGNPGPAGTGVVIYDENKKVVQKLAKYLGKQTNNQAEYQALILGLRWAKSLRAVEVRCCLDSELVVKQMRGEYKVKNPNVKPLYEKAVALTGSFAAVSFSHVSREKNKEADKLVNEAIDSR